MIQNNVKSAIRERLEFHFCICYLQQILQSILHLSEASKLDPQLCYVFIMNRRNRPEVCLVKFVLKICRFYRRRTMPTWEITLWYGCSLLNLLYVFIKTFPKSIFEQLLLNGSFILLRFRNNLPYLYQNSRKI